LLAALCALAWLLLFVGNTGLIVAGFTMIAEIATASKIPVTTESAITLTLITLTLITLTLITATLVTPPLLVALPMLVGKRPCRRLLGRWLLGGRLLSKFLRRSGLWRH